MAKVQIFNRLRLAPSSAPVLTPPPVLTPIAPVQDADQRSLNFPRGPAPGSRLSAEFVGEIGRFAYFWAWPMVNVYNRFTSLKRIWRPILIGGIAPVAPINHLAMLHDYIGPRQRYITCPSQDLIYGFGILDLGREPVVVQVPDFGKRYWVYQATDLRTDGFAELGAMYDTKPGFYLLIGPDWQGKQPDGINATFRAATNVGTIVPRVFQEDTRADNAALQPLIRQIAAYPLSEFDGAMKSRDWSSLPSIPWIKLGNEEWKWVEPKSFFDVLPEVLDACPPLPGEEGLYALVRSVLAAGAADLSLHNVLAEAAAEADASLVKPLLEFRNFGIPLPYNWTTVINSAEFGTDYYTRTAVAKSNTFIARARRAISTRTSTPRARGCRARKDTPSPSTNLRRSRASGRSPSTTSITSSRRTRSSAFHSAPRAKSCASSLTARSSFMCRATARARRGWRIGCPRRKVHSRFTSAPIGHVLRFKRSAGRRRPSCALS